MERLVIVGVDGSAGGRQALHWAIRHALATGARVEVVSAYKPEPLSFAVGGTDGRDLSEAFTAEQQAQDLRDVLMHYPNAPKVTTRVIPGKPANVLLDVARDADLLILGSHGKGAIETTLLGSVSEACVRRGTTPVLIIPAHHAP